MKQDFQPLTGVCNCLANHKIIFYICSIFIKPNYLHFECLFLFHVFLDFKKLFLWVIDVNLLTDRFSYSLLFKLIHLYLNYYFICLLPN